MRILPAYQTPADFRCPSCGDECAIIALDNAFNYSATHCRGAGTSYPSDYGSPISSCCEAHCDDALLTHHEDYWENSKR